MGSRYPKAACKANTANSQMNLKGGGVVSFMEDATNQRRAKQRNEQARVIQKYGGNRRVEK